MMSLLVYSQKTLEENDFPVKVEYQGKHRVLITLDQVDSLNLTYSYLDECEEYSDSLEKINVGYKSLVNQGLKIESKLRNVLSDKDKIITTNNEIIKEYESIDSKQKRKIKILKLTRNILAGATAVLLIVVLL